MDGHASKCIRESKKSKVMDEKTNDGAMDVSHPCAFIKFNGLKSIRCF